MIRAIFSGHEKLKKDMQNDLFFFVCVCVHINNFAFMPK